MEEIVQLESVTEYNQMRGVTALHPQITVLDLAKERIFDFGKSISEIFYTLGFRYP